LLSQDDTTDFATLAPEINSARMYAGPGPGPMLVAASAWDALAAELQSSAASYRAAISELTGGPWLGASSAEMTAATIPYLDWMTIAAGQAEQTATQARAAAAAYETAFAMTVPPVVIAADRSLLMTRKRAGTDHLAAEPDAAPAAGGGGRDRDRIAGTRYPGAIAAEQVGRLRSADHRAGHRAEAALPELTPLG
jgi:hypothetical protein